MPHLIEAIKKSKEKGLNIPVIYNSSGYESIETIKLLNGYIDVYLPDFKYSYNELSYRLSSCKDYYEVVQKSIKEMVDQVGVPKFDEQGLIKKGVIIRHLILPNHLQNTKRVIKWIKKNMPKEIYVSIMAQYFPTFKACEFNDINRKLNIEELNEIKEFIDKLDIKNGYIQSIEENEQKYVPNF